MKPTERIEMPTVDITYLTPLLEITGKRRDSLQIEDGFLLKDLLNKLSTRYGPEFEKLVRGENSYIVFLINGRSIHEHGFETKLTQGDSVLMGILVGGG